MILYNFLANFGGQENTLLLNPFFFTHVEEDPTEGVTLKDTADVKSLKHCIGQTVDYILRYIYLWVCYLLY